MICKTITYTSINLYNWSNKKESTYIVIYLQYVSNVILYYIKLNLIQSIK